VDSFACELLLHLYLGVVLETGVQNTVWKCESKIFFAQSKCYTCVCLYALINTSGSHQIEHISVKLVFYTVLG